MEEGGGNDLIQKSLIYPANAIHNFTLQPCFHSELHSPVFTANVLQELSTSQLMQTSCCEFVTLKLVSHSQKYEPGLSG